MRKILILTLILIAAMQSASGYELGVKVLDGAGSPLQNASIEILHLRQVEPLDACIFALVSIANVSTNASGEIKLELEDGSYVVSVLAENAVIGEHDIKLHSDAAMVIAANYSAPKAAKQEGKGICGAGALLAAAALPPLTRCRRKAIKN